jgi:hypothetical protein
VAHPSAFSKCILKDALPLWIKRPTTELAYQSPSNAKFKNVWSYASLPYTPLKRGSKLTLGLTIQFRPAYIRIVTNFKLNHFIFLVKILKSTQNNHVSGLLKITEDFDRNLITKARATFEFSIFSPKAIPNIRALPIFEGTSTL